MKKLMLKNLDAYCLSVEEKKQVTGGLNPGPCLACAIGWVMVVNRCQYVVCKSCNEFPASHPGCGALSEEPINCCD